MRYKKKAEASTPFWFQAFGFLLVVIAFVAMGSWGINAFGATDNLNNVISEATLDNFINSLSEFEDSDDAKRSVDITLAENAALIYYAPGEDFKFQIQSNLPTQGINSVDIIRDNFGRFSEFPLECPPNEPCICICTEARGSSNIECSQKICKKSPIVFNETHVLKDVFSQDYEYSESSWEGGFLIASNHELIFNRYSKDPVEYVTVYGREALIKSFAGITMHPTKKSSEISLLLEKNSDDKTSIKWGEDIN
jgi:hypothetical protein